VRNRRLDLEVDCDTPTRKRPVQNREPADQTVASARWQAPGESRVAAVGEIGVEPRQATCKCAVIGVKGR